MDKRNGIKNFTYGILAQGITIALGIIVPRLVLVNLGSESNGLLSSVGNILAYMSLLEAGVGTATLNALYAPLGKHDRDGVNRIMAATHYFYKRTGYIYFSLVVVIALVYALFIETNLSKFSVFLVVLLAGLSGVISYFYQGKFKILLQAEGKNYITTNIVTFVGILTSIGKIFLLTHGFDVVAIQTMHFILILVQMILIWVYVRRHYDWIDLAVEPDVEAISQRKAVLIHQISGLIFSNTDVLLLTFFTNLKVVSVYSMYVMIFGMVKFISVSASSSYSYAIGQTFKLDRMKFLRMFDAYEVFSMAFTSALFCIAGILMTPFLKLYTSGVNDICYTDSYLPWLFVAFYLLHNGRVSSSAVIDFAQEFEGTKWRSILESAINIVASVILVYYLGIYGVVLGTIVALLYRANDMIIYAAGILKRSPWVTYRRWLTNIALLILCALATSYIPVNLDSYARMFAYGAVLALSVMSLYFVVNSLMEPSTALYAWNVIKGFRKSGRK